MDGCLIFRAVKCLACSLPVSGRGILSTTVQQVTTLGRPVSACILNRARLQRFAAPSFSLHTTTHQPAQAADAGSQGLDSRTTAVLSPLRGLTPTKRPSLLPVAVPSVTQTRGRAEIYYRPSAWKRVNKHGIECRLRSPGGVEVLWRRILKKRHCLTPFDRILPGTYNGQILPKHHLKYNQHLVSKDVRKRMKQALGNK